MRVNPVIVEVGLNEAAPRALNVQVPYSAAECAADALRCGAAGAAVVHWHARVRRDPRASFLVESGERWAELRAAHVSGRAPVVTEPELLARVADALDVKYGAFRKARAAMPAGTRAHYEVARTTLEIVPDDRMLSWDNARLGLR